MGNGSSKDNNNNSTISINLSRTLTKEQFKKHLTSPSADALRSLSLADRDACTHMVEKLDCSVNAIASVPQHLATSAPHLELLKLDYNSLATLPDSLGNLSHLVELSLVHNKLNEIPKSLYRLSRLKKLDVSQNQLTQLHPGISALTSLERLNLECNDLRTLPCELGRCTSLYCLLVAGNRQLTFPPCVRDTSSKSVLTFLRSGQVNHETRPMFMRICDNHILEPSSPLVRYMLTETCTQHTAQRQRTPLRQCLTECHRDRHATYVRDQLVGLIYGCAIGSSIGLNCNRMSSDECIFHYGAEGHELCTNNQSGRHMESRPHSDWSSDFEQVLLILDSLVNWGGVIDELDFSKRLKLWSEHDDNIYDLDFISQNVLAEEDYCVQPIEASRRCYDNSSHDKRHLHNSTLVRSTVIGAVQLDKLDEVIVNCSRVCLSTHASELAVACNRAVACCVALIIRNF